MANSTKGVVAAAVAAAAAAVAAAVVVAVVVVMMALHSEPQPATTVLVALRAAPAGFTEKMARWLLSRPRWTTKHHASL